MTTFVINRGIPAEALSPTAPRDREIRAALYASRGDFVDFIDDNQDTVYRVRASDVYTIDRVDEQPD